MYDKPKLACLGENWPCCHAVDIFHHSVMFFCLLNTFAKHSRIIWPNSWINWGKASDFCYTEHRSGCKITGNSHTVQGWHSAEILQSEPGHEHNPSRNRTVPCGLSSTDLRGAQLHLYGRKSEGGNSEQKLCAVSLASSSQAGHATYLYVELWASIV